MSARARSTRLKYLIVALCVVVAALLISHLGIRLPRGLREPTILDDPFVTEETVLMYLDGQKIPLFPPPSTAGTSPGWLVLRRERIQNLKMTSNDPRDLSLRFTTHHDQRNYLVEANLSIWHSDSPSLHYHDYRDFVAVVHKQ
jgi:hypothetical protein